MQRSVYLIAAASLPLALWAAQGCSSAQDADDSSNTDAGNGADGGNGDTDGGSGGPGTDSGGNQKTDSGGADGGGVTTPGTQLKAITDASIIGVTTDGHVIYMNNVGSDAGAVVSVESVALAGGASTVIIPAFTSATDDFAVVGNAVAYYKNVDQTTGIADTLQVWTTTTNKLSDLGTKSLDGLFDVSADGTYAVFSTDATPAAAPTALTLEVNKTDGTGTATLLSAAGTAHIDDDSCFPSVVFKKAIAFGNWCATKAATTATIASIDTAAAGTAQASSKTALPGFFTVDDNGTHSFWLSGAKSTGTITAYNSVNNPVTEAINTQQGLLNTDATRVIYSTTTGGLSSANTATPIKATALTTGVAGILVAANDYSSVIVNRSAVDQTTNADVARVDMELASAFDAGPQTPLTDAGLPVGFATANGYFFFMTDLPATGQIPMGTLRAHPTAGGADKMIAAGAIFPTLVDATTKVVWLQNVQQTASGGVAVDIASADATTGTPTVVIQGADPGYNVSGGKIVYFSAGKGIYAVAVP